MDPIVLDSIFPDAGKTPRLLRYGTQNDHRRCSIWTNPTCKLYIVLDIQSDASGLGCVSSDLEYMEHPAVSDWRRLSVRSPWDCYIYQPCNSDESNRLIAEASETFRFDVFSGFSGEDEPVVAKQGVIQMIFLEFSGATL
jgi:hypothetical protein